MEHPKFIDDFLSYKLQDLDPPASHVKMANRFVHDWRSWRAVESVEL